MDGNIENMPSQGYQVDTNPVIITCPNENVTCRNCKQKGHFAINCKGIENMNPENPEIRKSRKVIENLKEMLIKSQQEAKEIRSKKYLLEHLKIEIDMQLRKKSSQEEHNVTSKNTKNDCCKEVEEVFEGVKEQLQDSLENILNKAEVRLIHLQNDMNSLQEMYEKEVASYQRFEALKQSKL